MHEPYLLPSVSLVKGKWTATTWSPCPREYSRTSHPLNGCEFLSAACTCGADVDVDVACRTVSIDDHDFQRSSNKAEMRPFSCVKVSFSRAALGLTEGDRFPKVAVGLYFRPLAQEKRRSTSASIAIPWVGSTDILFMSRAGPQCTEPVCAHTFGRPLALRSSSEFFASGGQGPAGQSPGVPAFKHRHVRTAVGVLMTCVERITSRMRVLQQFLKVAKMARFSKCKVLYASQGFPRKSLIGTRILALFVLHDSSLCLGWRSTYALRTRDLLR